MAKRYDQKTKDEVVNFIKAHNDEHGRGGQSAAVRKWDINPITVKKWCEAAGVSTPGKTGKKKTASKKGKKSSSPLWVAPKQPSAQKVLTRMLEIQRDVDKLQAEYDHLKKQL